MDPDAASEHDKAAFLAALEALQIECSAPDWDGYGADAIGAELVQLVLKLTRDLQPGVPWPDVAGEPDGGIGLEWFREKDDACHVSVGPGSEIHYVLATPGQGMVSGMLALDENGVRGLRQLLSRFLRRD